MGKPKRKRYPEPSRGETPDGTVFELGTPEQIFLEELRGSQAEIIGSIRKGLEGDHEPSRVTNAAKVLEALDDQRTPEQFRPKLEELRQLAMEALMSVSKDGKVAAARAQANAILLRAMRGIGRLDWPPDESDPIFSARFNTAMDVCRELRA